MRYIVFFIFTMSLMGTAYTARIKDIASLSGIRDNQLIGYGLVVGLDRTGDKTNQTPFTDQTFRNMLLQFGIKMPAGSSSQLLNTAAVVVSATLHPFARAGQKIDVTVSSLGNATSLRGGNLLMLPLVGADNQVYAMAQGNVVVSGVEASGKDGSKVAVNSTSTGRIPNGATVEKTIDMPYVKNGFVTYEIRNPDFTTAQRIADTINKELGYHAAQPIDPGAVAVKVSQLGPSKESFLKNNSYVNFISDLENLMVEPGETSAKIIINARSGTVVMGQDVTVSPVAISHGNLSVSVKETEAVSQPGAFSKGGKTEKTNDSQVNISQDKERTFIFQPRATLKDIVNAINHVGAAASDLILILEAMKEADAIHAELEII